MQLIGLLIAALGLLLGIVQPWESGNKTPTQTSSAANSGLNSGNICADHSTCTIDQPRPTASPTPSPLAALAINADTQCPGPDATVPKPPQVIICVLYWCHAPVYSTDGREERKQYQIKLRPLITNYSNHPVRISVDNPSAIRLLIQGSNVPQNWRPRPGTRNDGDRPVKVSYRGTLYWAIPPNRPGTEVPVPSIMQYTGFATTWTYGPNLGPGRSAGSVQPGHDIEDLVFNVPLPVVPTSGAVRDVYGLALLRFSGATASVVAFTDAHDEWERQEQPDQF